MVDLCVFFMGASLVSFIQAVSYRYVRKMDFIKGRSMCEHCHHVLSWYELIPVISFVLLKGRCHHCHTRLSLSYFILEGLGGFVFVFIFHRYESMIFLMFCLFLILLFIVLIDIETMDVYLWTVILFFVFSILIRMNNGIDVLDMLLGAFSVSSFMLFLNILIKDCFGYGDIELMFVSGMLLGFHLNVLSMVIAILTGGIYAAWLLLKNRRGYIAFTPFLVSGIVVSLFFGDEILNYYFLSMCHMMYF